jgi:asparagine synthase (glutamine-hydrolysing)
MCGIVGAFWKKPPCNIEQRLKNAVACMKHRGPDDLGTEIFNLDATGVLCFGHARLSIIDLSPGGHQPMHTADGRYSIVFNGEIYNYRELREELKVSGYKFHTDSDTEVLLAGWTCWGRSLLPKLRGMFAFVVFDHQLRTLTAARDPFGIKPFFYYLNQDRFCFASELPALLEVFHDRPRLNIQRAYDYLRFGDYDSREATFYQDIHHLMPGHVLFIKLNSLEKEEIIQWWWPSIIQRDIPFKDAAEQVREMFLQNIRLHLRSDVPLGAALSGGIDSSAVVCAMRHVEPSMPIHTFTYVARGSAVDEEHWADMVNRHVGAIAHKIVVEPNEMADDLNDMILSQGEPFGSTSIYAQYRVFRLAKENGITVTLDGQGADELLAGYNGYPNSRVRSYLERMEWIQLYRFIRGWSQYPGRSRKKANSMVRQGIKSLLITYRGQKLTRVPSWLDVKVLSDKDVFLRLARPICSPEASGRRLVEALRSSLTGNGLMQLLRHGDRNSMHWSIESRVPFLTHDFAEFLLSLPEEYLLSPTGETKHIFRTAMRGIVPDAILDRRDKIGFQTPESNWLKLLGGNLMGWIASIDDVPMLDAKVCRSLIQDVLDGKQDSDGQIWRLINFCKWVELSGVKC